MSQFGVKRPTFHSSSQNGNWSKEKGRFCSIDPFMGIGDSGGLRRRLSCESQSTKDKECRQWVPVTLPPSADSPQPEGIPLQMYTGLGIRMHRRQPHLTTNLELWDSVSSPIKRGGRTRSLPRHLSGLNLNDSENKPAIRGWRNPDDYYSYCFSSREVAITASYILININQHRSARMGEVTLSTSRKSRTRSPLSSKPLDTISPCHQSPWSGAANKSHR